MPEAPPKKINPSKFMGASFDAGSKLEEKVENNSILLDNVVNALVNLGYKKTEAIKVCNKLVDAGEFNGSIELLIKKSLSKLIP